MRIVLLNRCQQSFISKINLQVEFLTSTIDLYKRASFTKYLLKISEETHMMEATCPYFPHTVRL